MKISTWKVKNVPKYEACAYSFLEFRWKSQSDVCLNFVIYLLHMMCANLDLSDGRANSRLFQVGDVSGFEGHNPLKVVKSFMGHLSKTKLKSIPAFLQGKFFFPFLCLFLNLFQSANSNTTS